MKPKDIEKIELDGRTITSMESFYDQISKALKFPEWFGRNLDALEECLLHEAEGPIKVIWMHSADSARAIGPKFSGLRQLLERDLPGRRPDIEFRFE